jgi:hypothetical protein
MGAAGGRTAVLIPSHETGTLLLGHLEMRVKCPGGGALNPSCMAKAFHDIKSGKWFSGI